MTEEKIRSWKEFCTSTDSTKAWKAVYINAAGKLRSKLTLSTFKTSDNTHTTDTINTVDRLMDQFVPEDNEESDEAHHKQVRRIVTEPLNTKDVPFTK